MSDSTKIVKNILKVIDQNDPKRKLGRVKQRPPRNFQFKPNNLVTSPNDPKAGNNIIWKRRYFQHDRGRYHQLSWSEFQNNHLQEWETLITSNNGNFKDTNLPANVNVFYQSLLIFDKKVTITFNIKAVDCSITIHKKPMLKIGTTELGSGNNASYVSGKHTITFDPNTDGSGNYILTIKMYRQKVGGYIEVSGDLGSYVNSYIEPRGYTSFPMSYDITRGTNGIESKFIDGKNGPQLANIIYWNKVESDLGLSNSDDIHGYSLNRILKEDIGFDVVSGWGTDAFAVSGDKRNRFPIAGTAIIPGPINTEYPISGTSYNSNIDQTVVTLSGTFNGSASDDILIERSMNIQNIWQDAITGPIISGSDLNVTSNETYTYQINTFDRLGNKGPRSTKISVVAGDFIPPGLVTSLTASAGNKSIELNWTNPSNDDLKGVHIWDKDNIVSGTDRPLLTLLKGSNTTVPDRAIIAQTTSGTLIDDWLYNFYVSTFDWAGNEQAHSMPTDSATTTVEIKTKRTGQRVETDTATNQLRFYNANDNLLLKVGENIEGSLDGLLVTDGVIELEGQTSRLFFIDSSLGAIGTDINMYLATDSSATGKLIVTSTTNSNIDFRDLNVLVENNLTVSGSDMSLSYATVPGPTLEIEYPVDGSGNALLWLNLSHANAAGALDPYIKFSVASNHYSFGIDNSDSDLFKFSNNATLGTNDVLTINPSNGDIRATGVISGSGNAIFVGGYTRTGVGLNAVEINANQGNVIPFRRGITIPNDPNGQLQFFVHSFQSSAKFEFIDGNTTNRWLTVESNLTSGTGNAIFDGDLDVGGDVTFGSGGGLGYGEISSVGNSAETAISTAGVAVQVTIFDTNGPSNNGTAPDHTNDHLTISKAGDYLILVSATVNSVVGADSRFEMTVKKNNGTADVGALHCDRNIGGGGAKSGVISMSGLATLAINDTIEVWIENETNTQNYIVEDITLSVVMIGG